MYIKRQIDRKDRKQINFQKRQKIGKLTEKIENRQIGRKDRKQIDQIRNNIIKQIGK